MADDWDLHAVVRGCCSGAAAATSSSSAPAIADDPFHFLIPDPFEPTRSNHIEDLQDLFKPFVPKLKPLLPISPFSVLGGLKDLSPPHAAVIPPPPPQLQPKQQQQQKQYVSVIGASANVTPRSKRRKTQMKKVCQVAAEDLSSDTWSWRKYGQKPIKGSPYPRGYYKCSTSKGCLARKQVERNRSEPGMFIVTYTADHNHPMPTHRNSLAGSTRQKPETLAAVESNKPSCSSPATLSPATTERRENREEREDFLEVDEEDEFGVSDMAISDDFFEGLEEFTGSDNGDCFSDHRPASLTASWLGNSAATAAGGDG